MKLTLKREFGEEIADGEVRVLEYEPIQIEITTPHDVRSPPDIFIDGASIGQPEVLVREERLCWRWNFRSESWCGRATLTATCEGETRNVIVRAIPSGAKYSERDYERMIEYILTFGPNLLWGLAPGQSAASEALLPQLRAIHPALIQQYLGPLLKQLIYILRDPVLKQRRVQELAPFQPRSCLAPNTLSWFAARSQRLDDVKTGNHRIRVPQPLRQDTFDHPANRYVLTLVRRLRASFGRTAMALVNFSAQGLIDDLEKKRAEHLAALTRIAANELSRALDQPVFRNLDPGEMSEGVTQVFGDHPTYGRFARLARRLLSSGVQLDRAGDLETALRRTWDLFEIYCLYKLVDHFERGLGHSWKFYRHEVTHHVLCDPPEGRFWSATHPDGQSWVLFYQRLFGNRRNGPFTVTQQRRPDFILAGFSGERLDRWIVLDAKYRTAKDSIHEALASMHVYRDSLRWRCEESGVVHAPYAGYLLVPAVADQMLRFADEEYLTRWRIGICRIDDELLAQRLLKSAK